jgi:hypothetical protein
LLLLLLLLGACFAAVLGWNVHPTRSAGSDTPKLKLNVHSSSCPTEPALYAPSPAADVR